MTAKLHILLICTILLVSLLALPSKVYACECMGSLSHSIQGSDVVFAGRAVEIVEAVRPRFNRYVVFEVSTIWKGPTVATIIVSDWGCMFPFKTGQDYLVYAQLSSDGKRLYADKCGGAVRLQDVPGRLKAMGEGQTPQEGIYPPPSSNPLSRTLPFIAISGLALALLGLGIVARRRHAAGHGALH